jgi:hypothetical protein
VNEKLRELVSDFSKECGESDKDSRIRVSTARYFIKKLLAILDAEGDSGVLNGEVVGTLNVSRYRGIDSMVNHDFDYYGNLKDGTYNLYTHPARSGREAEAYLSGFIEACKWSAPIAQDVDSKAFEETLANYIKSQGESHDSE